jgi:putative DNA-binding protein/uncharacterized protein
MDLAALQELLGGAFGGLTPLGDRPELADQLHQIVGDKDTMTPIEQADVYREQFWLRHGDALREDFPGLRHLLGDDAFDALLRGYLLAYPPDSWTLRDLCRKMAVFCDEYAGFAADVAAVARDMARFEVAFEDIFDGADAAPIGPERVAEIPPEAWIGARLGFHPLLTLLSLGHPVHELRLALKEDKDPPRTVRAEPTHLAMWRGADLKVHYRAIDAAEHRLLESLRRDARLGDACAELAAAGERDADEPSGEEQRADEPSGEEQRVDEPSGEEQRVDARLGAWFRAWAMRGWIVSVRVDPA